MGDTEIELYLSEPGEKILAVSSDDNMPVVRLNDEGTTTSGTGTGTGSGTGSGRLHSQSPTLTLMNAVDDGELPRLDGETEIDRDPDPLLAALYEMGPATAAGAARAEQRNLAEKRARVLQLLRRKNFGCGNGVGVGACHS